MKRSPQANEEAIGVLMSLTVSNFWNTLFTNSPKIFRSRLRTIYRILLYVVMFHCASLLCSISSLLFYSNMLFSTVLHCSILLWNGFHLFYLAFSAVLYSIFFVKLLIIIYDSHYFYFCSSVLLIYFPANSFFVYFPLVITILCQVIYLICTYICYFAFGWKIFHRIHGYSPAPSTTTTTVSHFETNALILTEWKPHLRITRLYSNYQIFQSLLQIDLLQTGIILILSCLFTITNTNITHFEGGKYLWISAAVLSIYLICNYLFHGITLLAMQREKKFVALIWLVFQFGMVIYCVFQIVYSFTNSSIYFWKIHDQFNSTQISLKEGMESTIASLILLTQILVVFENAFTILVRGMSIIFGIICVKQFDSGLKERVFQVR